MSTNGTMPPSTLGDVNVKRYFALAFIQQCGIKLANERNERDGSYESSTFGKTVDAYLNEMLSKEDRLIEANNFGPQGADLYDGFRAVYQEKIGDNLSKWMAEKKITLKLPAKKVLLLCLEEVQTWWPSDLPN